MRLAIVGAGGRAQIARHALELRDEVRIVAVVDPDPAALDAAIAAVGDGAVTYESTSSLLADDSIEIDAAIVATPDHTHEDIASELLKAGVAVYLEKPMAITAESADRLLAVARASRSKLYVGHNMRHMAVITLMREIIERGEIGEVKAVWCRHFVGNGGDYYFKDWHAERAFSNTLLLQKGAHDLDVIHLLAGDATRQVTGMAELAVYGQVADRRDNSDRRMADWFSFDHWPPLAQRELNPVIDVEDLSMVHMRLGNGVLASYQQCHFTPDYWRNYTVIGTEGRIENFGDGEGGVVRVWNRRHGYAPAGDVEYPIRGDLGGHEDADRLTMAEFLDFVIDGAPTRTSPLAAREAVATADYAARSARNGGGMLEVPPLDADLARYFEQNQPGALMRGDRSA